MHNRKPNIASSHSAVTRRQFLHTAGAALGVGLFGASCRQNVNTDHRSKELNIYNWADYVHPDAVSEFERRYDIRINYDTFASNEALLAKLQAGNVQYDIVVPSNFILSQLAKLDLLQPIDHTRLPNLTNLMPRFLSPVADPNLIHSVPYLWGTTGIAYNLNVVEQLRGSRAKYLAELEEESWSLFWDKHFAGRITLLDDERETIGMSLKRLGFSYNSRDYDQINQSKVELLRQKPLIMCYTSDQVIVQLSCGDSFLALAYSGDAYQAARSNRAVHYFIPKTGTSIWVDSLCIPKYAPHPDAAYRWINFMLEPSVSAKNAEYTCYATPNQLGLARLDRLVKFDSNLYPPDAVIERCEQLMNVGELTSYYDRIWTELKCA